MATTYGNTVNGRWCAYMNWSTSSNNTQTTLTVECCLQVNNYSVSYNNVTGDVSIDFSVNKSAKKSINKSYGAGTTYYSFCSASKTFTRGKSASDKAFSAGVTFGAGSSNWAGSSRAYGTLTVQPKPSYKVSYNANGGSGAPGAQTKWYGENLTLSSTKPTRTGYKFLRWSATINSGTVNFNPGATYTYNSAATLYAAWQANTYTVSFNANGGSGAPGAQTKTYGQTLYLSSTRPTRTNYNFKGWATSASATTAQYQPGGAFTTNAATTLYAVWELAYVKPRITNLNADRCNSAGTLTEDGQYAKVTFNWATDRTVSSIKIVCNGVTTTVSGQSGTSGSVSKVVGANALNTESQYTISATVADSGGSTTTTTSVAPMEYIMDIEPGGSMAFGGPARSFSSGLETVEFYNGIVHHKPPMVSTEATSSGNGSTGYNKILTLTNGAGATYSNSSIEITFVQRSRHVCTVNLYASNANSQAITVGSALGIAPSSAFGNNSVYYRQPTSNVIELWVKKTESYDMPKVVNVFYDRYYMSKLEMDTTQSFSASLPSGSVAIAIRSLLGLPYTQVGGYYGMTLADGSSSEWMRTTYNGLIPYQQGGASALGTNTWPFNTAWVNQLNWTGNGLRGRCFKKIWSGTANEGAVITVSEMPYYNLFGFEISTYVCLIPVMRGKNLDSDTYCGIGGYGIAGGGNARIVSITCNASGSSTKVSLSELNIAGSANITNTANTTLVGIYGIL